MQALRRQWDIQRYGGHLSPWPGKSRGVGHLADRGDSGNRLRGELTQRIRDSADEPSVDIYGASAHACDDAGPGQRSSLKTRKNQVAARADDVAEYANDVGLKLVEAVAFEHRFADADHAGPQLINWECPALSRQAADQKHQQGSDGGERSHEHR